MSKDRLELLVVTHNEQTEMEAYSKGYIQGRLRENGVRCLDSVFYDLRGDFEAAENIKPPKPMQITLENVQEFRERIYNYHAGLIDFAGDYIPQLVEVDTVAGSDFVHKSKIPRIPSPN